MGSESASPRPNPLAKPGCDMRGERNTRESPHARRRVPDASSAQSRRRMENQKQRDTRPERLIRSALHRQGFRFWVDKAPLPKMRRKADLVFPRARVAVFIDGCFWHGCPVHGTWPKANADWWRAKIEANRRRDRDTDRVLVEAGWLALRIWEHENPTHGTARIARVVEVRTRRATVRLRKA